MTYVSNSDKWPINRPPWRPPAAPSTAAERRRPRHYQRQHRPPAEGEPAQMKSYSRVSCGEAAEDSYGTRHWPTTSASRTTAMVGIWRRTPRRNAPTAPLDPSPQRIHTRDQVPPRNAARGPRRYCSASPAAPVVDDHPKHTDSYVPPTESANPTPELVPSGPPRASKRRGGATLR